MEFREKTKLSTVSEFLADTDTYNQNILKLVKYCNVSQISHKLQGFVEKYNPAVDPTRVEETKKGVGAFLESIQKKNQDSPKQEIKTDGEPRKPGSSSLLGIVEFLSTLATNFGDSRIVIKTGSTLAGAGIRFLLLDPATQFKGTIQKNIFKIFRFFHK